MKYRDIIGYSKKQPKKRVVKEQKKPSVVDNIKQELNEWNDETFKSMPKRWSGAYGRENGLTEFEEKMNLIAKENGIFGILASLDLIKKSLSNNDYNYAYNVYLKLLKSKDSNRIYNSIIALHGSYNLIDNVSSDKVSNLLSFVDESSNVVFRRKESLYFILFSVHMISFTG